MKSFNFKWGFLVFLGISAVSSSIAQSPSTIIRKLDSEISGKTTTDVLGHGFDIRKIDPLHWGASSKGKAIIEGNMVKTSVNREFPTSYHFVSNTYEYERDVLDADTLI